MDTTPASLLHQLGQPRPADAWDRFVQLYSPLLYYWARRSGVPVSAAADLVQDVFVELVQRMPEFRYDPGRSFRAWLRTVIVNKWRAKLRRRPVQGAATVDLDRLEDSWQGDAFEEVEYRRHLVARALEVMQREFEPTTWKACWEFVVSEKSAAVVASELGVSVDVVYAAKYRVLRKLRTELEGLWE